MKTLTTEQSFLNAQLAILELAPVERKLNLLKLANQHGLKDLTRHYPSGSVFGGEGQVSFPNLNIEVEGYPATGSGEIFSHGGVHIRRIEQIKPSLYFGVDLNVSTLDGVLDRKFAVKLQTIQETKQSLLTNPSIIVSFVVPRKYRLSDAVTKWDYLHVVSPNSENLRGAVRQGLRRKLRKSAANLTAEYFAAQYFENLLA